MSDPHTLQERSMSEDQRIDYFLPLRQFERCLIHELQSILNEHSFDNECNQETSPEEAFSKWRWANDTEAAFKGKFETGNMQCEYDGDRNKAYIGLLEDLKLRSITMRNLTIGRLTDQNTARVNEINELNPDFISRLGEQPIEAVVVCPLAQDTPLWETIARILPKCEPFLKERFDLFASSNNTFEILHLVKQFVLFWRLPFNRDIIFGLLINDPGFQAIYSVTAEYSQAAEMQDMEGSYASPLDLDIAVEQQLSIVKRFSISKESRSEDEPKYKRSREQTFDQVRQWFDGWERCVELADPEYYIHFIDWGDLNPISEDELHRAQISTNVPFAHQDLSTEWFIWKPPHKGFIWNHHLYTEDEVFEYNMIHCPWPDHYLDDLVIFHAREIFATGIVGDLHNFWNTWNDCAITQQPEDGPTLLLETIPGMRFRSRCKYQDQKSAMIYFRNLVEAHATDSKNTQYLRDALGLEATYAPVFEHSLRLIPEADLSGISWNEPLGRGANGVVFSAIYNRRSGLLASSKAAESRIPVVLKDVISRSSDFNGARKKFIQELDLAFSSLGNGATRCVGFLGIAALKKPDNSLSSANKEELYLVFERATQGPILNFVLGYFKSMNFFTSWDKLVDILTSIGAGIHTLHQHHVLHRDLHMNNILVTDNFMPNDPMSPHEFQYLISDIGEGKILRDGIEFEHPSNNLASYGAAEFRAPEVHGGKGWTTKAEVFSFGVIATKILQARQMACTAEPPAWIIRSIEGAEHPVEDGELVPVIFEKAIEACLQFLADDRLDMKNVLQHLADFQSNFYQVIQTEARSSSEGKNVSSASINEFNMQTSKLGKEPLVVKWTYWNWKRALQLARRPKERVTIADISYHNLDEPLAMPTLD